MLAERGRAHVFSSQSDKSLLLSLQSGNRGFGEQFDKIIVVTSDVRCFVHIGERYQFWIDGGMFGMSVFYALHSLGLGTCCLNWSVTHEVDWKFMKALSIAASERVIMIIGVGHLPQQLKVARSSRKELSEILVEH